MKKNDFKKELKKALSESKGEEIIRIKVSDKQLEKIIDSKLKEHLKNLPEKFKVSNWPDSFKIDKPDWLPNFPKEINIKNFPKQKEFPKIKIPSFPKEIEIKKPAWYKKINLKQSVNDLVDAFERLLDRHKEPENALAVRLTEANRDEFYNAISHAIAAGSFEIIGIKDSNNNRIDPSRHLSVNKAIEDLTQDLNAGAYSKTTAHSDVYRLSGLYLKFSSEQSKTVTLSLTNGTVSIPIWTKAADTATSRVFVPDKSWELPADWELKLDITQTGAACSADILLLTSNN